MSAYVFMLPRQSLASNAIDDDDDDDYDTTKGGKDST
jgi:hypothetical protein